jgi:hypothetical protein
MLTDPEKHCGCGAGHQTFGACCRAKNIRIGQVDASEQKRWDAELDEFRAASRQGIQPKTTQLKDIRAAVDISNKTGVAFDAGLV